MVNTILKTLLVAAIFILSEESAVAQRKITMYKTFGGVVFEMDTITLSLRQTMSVVYKNPRAYQEFKKAKKRLDISSVMGFSGGFLIAIPAVTAIAGGEPEWGLAAGGAALILGSIPIYRSFRGRALNALDMYNETQPTTRLRSELYFSGTALKWVVRF